MNRALTQDIDETLRTLFAGERVADDLRSLIGDAAESREFARLVLVAAGARNLDETALIMAAMMLAGMRIERRHQEIDLLERMYGGGAA